MSWFPLRKVSDVEVAFPACEWFPDIDEVPPEYKSPDRQHENSAHPAVAFMAKIIHGARTSAEVRALPREEVEWANGKRAAPDPEQAWRMLCCVAGTYGLKHEHKLAIAGWLLDSYFEHYWWSDEEPPVTIEE